MRVDIENPMVSDYYPRLPIQTFVVDKPECDCGSYAKLRIHGRLRCYDCAEEDGVERV